MNSGKLLLYVIPDPEMVVSASNARTPMILQKGILHEMSLWEPHSKTSWYMVMSGVQNGEC